MPHLCVQGSAAMRTVARIGCEHRAAFVTADVFFTVAVIKRFADKPHAAVGTNRVTFAHYLSAVRTYFCSHHYPRTVSAFFKPTEFCFCRHGNHTPS